jgi:phage N-6-adenine-methyltransferase
MISGKADTVKREGSDRSRLSNGLFTSRTEEWETPLYVFKAIDMEFRFQVDVCASLENTKCKIFFDKNVDGLKQEWSPFRCWMNPPYGKNISKWMKKAFHESEHGALVVCLIPCRTDTRWWHDWVMKAGEIRFIAGRISFGNGKQSAPFPSCIVVYYPELENPYKLSVPVIKSVKFDKANHRMYVLTDNKLDNIDQLLF